MYKGEIIFTHLWVQFRSSRHWHTVLINTSEWHEGSSERSSQVNTSTALSTQLLMLTARSVQSTTIPPKPPKFSNYIYIYTDITQKKKHCFLNKKQNSVCCEGNGAWRIWDWEGPRAPAVVVSHWWETRDSFTPCPVHVWLSHWGNRHCIWGRETGYL